MPNTSVVLFVFKSSEGLDEKPTVEYHGPDGPVGDRYQSYLTHREILEHCLKVLHAQGEKSQIIMLVGTHKDCLEKKLDSIELQECLKPFKEKVVLFPNNQSIALLNCLSNRDEDKKTVQDIKQQLLKVIKVKSQETQDVEFKETPMAWFGLELALKKASQSENSKCKGILTYEQCKQEADKFYFFRANSAQFEAALQHLVGNNIFLHYKVLPDVVFCDPQVLLTMVTDIVQYHYKLKHSQCAAQGKWEINFRDNACISVPILSHIASQYSDKDGVFPPESFVNLLLHLKIISAIQTGDSNGAYLMPALLSNVGDPAAMGVVEIEEKECLVPLCITFDGGCAPSGLFCALVATLLQTNKWELCMKDNKPRCLFRNCVTFRYGKSTIITLVDFFSHFSIYMYRPIDVKNQQVCPSTIRNKVHECIHAVAIDLHYPNLNFQDAIKCPKHLQENHVALWENDEYECTRDGTCTGPMPEEFYIWMKNTGLLKV